VVGVNEVAKAVARSHLERLALKLWDSAEGALPNAAALAKHNRSGAVAVPVGGQLVVRQQILRIEHQAWRDLVGTAFAGVLWRQRRILKLTGASPRLRRLGSR
jgi:uncharacterized protein (DUF1778 family)